MAATQGQTKDIRITSKKRVKILKYVSPPKQLLELENIPLTSPVSDEVLAFLSKGKLKDASRTLKSEPASAKSLHLSREIQRILAGKKGKGLSTHTVNQNMGVAYHNLFLLLKRGGVFQKSFFKKGLRYYKKALKTDSISEKTETVVLTASLLAAGGETKKAEKLFSETDIGLLDKDFKSYEYLASYYAAANDTFRAVETLKEAFKLRPEQTMIWIAISDDFYQIDQSEEFKAMQKEFASAGEQKKAKSKKKKKVLRKK